MTKQEQDKSQRNKEIISWVIGAIAAIAAIAIVAGLVLGVNASYRTYSVWSAKKSGEAMLAYADQERQVLIAQSKSKMEAAKYEAQAEVRRAEGIAKANKIIGDSLNNNPAYLTWKYYDALETTKNRLIYVPTENSLPITEAGRARR